MIDIPKDKLVIMMEAGYVYLGTRRTKEATEVFEGVLALAPESEIPMIALGSVSFCKGKFKDAIKLYKGALKKDPTSLFAKVYMAESLFFSGEKKDALSLLNEVDLHDRTGAAGDFARALKIAIEKGFSPDSLQEGVTSSKKGSGNVKEKKNKRIHS